MIPKCSNLPTWCREWSWDTLEVILFWGSTVKGQGYRVSKFILHTRTLHTFARWRNQSSAWVRNRDRLPSSSYCWQLETWAHVKDFLDWPIDWSIDWLIDHYLSSSQWNSQMQPLKPSASNTQTPPNWHVVSSHQSSVNTRDKNTNTARLWTCHSTLYLSTVSIRLMARQRG